MANILDMPDLKPKPCSYLQECVVRAIVLLELTPVGVPFNEEELKFFQDLYLWRRPEKFFLNDKEAKIVAGTTGMYRHRRGEDKALRFTFDNGYVWLASITKLNKSNIKVCRQIARDLIDEEYMREVA